MTDKPNLTRVWAKTAPGGNVVDPDTVTAGKFTAGWQAEVPPFEYFNFIQKQVTEGLAHINEQGIAVWDGVTTYPVGGLAKGSDGNVYKALVSQNNNNPVADDGTNWFDEINDRVIRVTSIANLLQSTNLPNFQVSVANYYADQIGGGGTFYWNSTKDKSLHNGYTIFSPTVPFPTGTDPIVGFLEGTGESDPTGAGVWVRRDQLKGITLEDAGIISGLDMLANNNLAMDYLLGEANSKEFVIYAGAGDYYLGRVNVEFTSLNFFRKGIIGKGVENTHFYLDNVEDEAMIYGTGAVFNVVFNDFLATARQGTSLANLLDLSSGFPRLDLSRVRANNFKDPFRINAWVCEIHNLISSNSLVGFSWIEGTSQNVSTCFALDCTYGHILGGSYSAAGFTAGPFLVYSNYTSLAADRCEHAYIFGNIRASSLSSCGIESGTESALYFPALIGNPNVSGQFVNARTTINNLYTTGTATPIVLLERDNASIELNNCIFSTNHTKFISYGALLTPEDTYINIALNRSSGIIQSGVSNDALGLIVDGIGYGNYAAYKYFSVEVPSPILRPLHFKSIVQIRGDEKLRIALTPDGASGNNVISKVRIAPTNNSSVWSEVFNGELYICASSTGDVLSVHASGNNTSQVSVSIVPSLKNTGGDDIAIEFSGIRAGSAYTYYAELEVTTTAASAIEFAWLAYVSA